MATGNGPRFYIPQPLLAGAELELPVEVANHLRVLRLREAAALTLFNGDGGEWPAELLSLERRSARVRVGEHLAIERESPLSVTLIQGISKGERMDYTIQKAVELGVRRILPVFSARSVVQLDGERLARREEHWRGVITSACEQCGRNRLAELEPPRALDTVWGELGDSLRLVLDPTGTTGLGAAAGHSELALLVGPEGGLTEDELDQAVQSGFARLRLGPRVLRTETAGMAALAALQALAGDLG